MSWKMTLASVNGPEQPAQPSALPTHPSPGANNRLDLERALAQLPPGFKHTFVLHDVEGYRHGEIARMLGVTEGTSKSQLHRAHSGYAICCGAT
jgi:DNA-directed RNA polymerase specialized sigma24 family protein